MKAWVLHGIGDLRYDETQNPAPGPGEVLLRVKACGVCGSDIPRIYTKGTYQFPLIPGHEFSGEVTGVGEGVAPELIGKGAAVFPLIPCGQCPSCEVGVYGQCDHYDYLGSRSDGGFAEYVTAPARNLVFIPEGISYEEAAMAEPAAVAIHALRRAGSDPGDVVLILGAGPVGVLVGLWAELSGAGKVLLADIDPEKLDFARSLGFKHLFNPKEGDLTGWVRGLTGRGVDITVEATGSAAAWEECLKTVRKSGKVILLGNPVGEMKLSQNGYWEILRKELTLVGTWNSSFSAMPKNEWKMTLELMAARKLHVAPLITHRIALPGLGEALEMMRSKREFYNKVMMVV